MDKRQSSLGLYTLNEKREPILATNIAEAWLDQEKFRVGLTKLPFVTISTVFLGIDHGFGRTDKPVLWETMIFGGLLNDSQWRYTSEADAIKGHRKAIKMVLLSPFEPIINWWKNIE
jgi:hypothetical protein